MRKDYEYIDIASSIEIVCTKKGDEYLEPFNLTDPGVDLAGICETNELVNTLLFLQEVYVFIRGTDNISMFDLWDTANRFYVEEYSGEDQLISFSEFVEAFVDGLIGIRKVIWD